MRLEYIEKTKTLIDTKGKEGFIKYFIFIYLYDKIYINFYFLISFWS